MQLGSVLKVSNCLRANNNGLCRVLPFLCELTPQVVFVDSLDAMDSTFEVLGPLLESCTAAFPQRVNAEFVQVLTTFTSTLYAMLHIHTVKRSCMHSTIHSA